MTQSFGWPTGDPSQLHYELHLTISTASTVSFIEKCKQLGVKPVVLDLQKRNGDVLNEVMTSSKLKTSDQTAETAAAEVKRLSSEFQKCGFNVVRSKIETGPWHPAAPSKENGLNHQPGQHFEMHFGVILSSQEQFERLMELSIQNEMHMSRNRFKELENGTWVQMTTYRSYELLAEDFASRTDEIKKKLDAAGFKLEKTPKIEFSLLDSNSKHDGPWLGV